QQEALLALMVGTAVDMEEKTAALTQVAEVRALLVRRQKWSKLEEKTIVQAIQKIAQRFGYRLTQAQLARALSVVGAVVGGAFKEKELRGTAHATYLWSGGGLWKGRSCPGALFPRPPFQACVSNGSAKRLPPLLDARTHIMLRE